ncbi:hypothetical protein ACOSQ3_016692 [Xanthoceras sorbifolium]
MEIDESIEISPSNPWRSLRGFIESMEESMGLPCPKLCRSSRRRGKAQRTRPKNRSKNNEIGSSIDEEPRNLWVLRRSKNPGFFE